MERKNTKELNFDFERLSRLEQIKNKGQGSIDLFQSSLLHISKLEMRDIKEALDYSLNLEYSHEGLTKEAYIAHPLRVSKMAIDFTKKNTTQTVILCLLHNILEVTNVEKQDIVKSFGKELLNDIETLTVDRALQWDKVYKKDYYEAIYQSSDIVKTVKVLDKLDNIYILGINPDKEIRRKYITEIKQFVLPMCKKVLPDLYGSFNHACNVVEQRGYNPSEK